MPGIGDWLREAAAHLTAAGLESSQLEARRLAEAALNLTAAELVLAARRPLTDEEINRLERLLVGRLAGTPLQYLTGRAAFRQLDLEVGPGVLVPRPETEGLVERGLPQLLVLARTRPPRVLELCVGSGAILAALLSECDAALGWGVELSPPALSFARRNLAAAGVGDRVFLFEGDLYGPLTAANVPPQSFDLIVANPPYIPDGAFASLPDGVRLFEPEVALRGGPAGTSVIARLVAGAADWLAPDGQLALEIDESHGERVLELFALADLREARVENDLAGRPRYALGRRAAG